MQVWIEEGCILCGNSEVNCPEVFKLKGGMATVLENDGYSGLEEKSSMLPRIVLLK